MIQCLGPEEAAIRSRRQHDAVPAWRPLPAELVCEIRASTIDGGRWLRQPATFLRCRPDLRPKDCCLDQLRTSVAPANRGFHGGLRRPSQRRRLRKRMTLTGNGSGCRGSHFCQLGLADQNGTSAVGWKREYSVDQSGSGPWVKAGVPQPQPKVSTTAAVRTPLCQRRDS
jgi:hypothetical protein